MRNAMESQGKYKWRCRGGLALTFILLMTYQILMSATEFSRDTLPPVVIEGRIEPGQDLLEILDAKVFVRDWVTGDQRRISEFPDDGGRYRLEFQLPFMQDVQVAAGHLSFSLLLEPGDSIYLFERATGPDQYELEITGDKADLNRLVYDYSRSRETSGVMQRFYDQLLPVQEMSDADQIASEFTSRIREGVRMLEDHLRNFLEQRSEAPLPFETWARYDITYDAAKEWVHAYARARHLHKVSLDDHVAFMAYGRQFAWNEPEAHISTSYLFFLNQLGVIRPGGSQMTADYKAQGLDPDLAPIDYIQQNSEGFAREVMLTHHYVFLTKHTRGLDLLEQVMPVFEQYVQHSYLRERFLSIYQSVTDPNPERISVSAALDLMNVPDSTKEVLPRILEKHKGKLVYLDFWATWCAPCLGELPHYRTIFEQVDTSKVAFVFLAQGSPENLWRQTIVRHDLEGTHLLLTRAQQAVLSNLFGIAGIPHHVLLDDQGKILYNPAAGPGRGLVQQLQGALENERK